MRVKYASEKTFKGIIEEGYKTWNVNMGFPIAKPSRKADKLKPKEFENKLITLYQKCSGNEEKKSLDGIIFWLARNAEDNGQEQFYHDIHDKLEVDAENAGTVGGVRTTSKGVPYLLCYMGGDWESPVAFATYLDGNKIRAYVPKHGNAWDTKRKIALGNNEENDHEFINKETNGKTSNPSYVSYNKDAVIRDIGSHLIPR